MANFKSIVFDWAQKMQDFMLKEEREAQPDRKEQVLRGSRDTLKTNRKKSIPATASMAHFTGLVPEDTSIRIFHILILLIP